LLRLNSSVKTGTNFISRGLAPPPKENNWKNTPSSLIAKKGDIRYIETLKEVKKMKFFRILST
jgi:hypothetical protein